MNTPIIMEICCIECLHTKRKQYCDCFKCPDQAICKKHCCLHLEYRFTKHQPENTEPFERRMTERNEERFNERED